MGSGVRLGETPPGRGRTGNYVSGEWLTRRKCV